jgi:hypothetical protein
VGSSLVDDGVSDVAQRKPRALSLTQPGLTYEDADLSTGAVVVSR